jgi:hypothetical protein
MLLETAPLANPTRCGPSSSAATALLRFPIVGGASEARRPTARKDDMFPHNRPDPAACANLRTLIQTRAATRERWRELRVRSRAHATSGICCLR